MAGRFVRASKYRHVFGRPTRKEQCYDNLRISKNAWDTNLVKANSNYLAVNWESSGGGAFAVVPLNERGKLPDQIPLFRGHTAVVLDTDWNPFNDDIIASGSDDGKAFIWRVPQDFTLFVDSEEIPDVAPVAKLTGHSRKVGQVLFNPSAENILATSSGDFTIKIWDIEAGTPKLTLKQTDIVQSLSYSANGSLMVTTSRDKKLRIWDVRQERPAHEGPGHAGAKNSRAVWMGELDRIATTGFSKMSDRQLGLWDVRNANAPINGFDLLDSISGVAMPFFDESTRCLYVAGKGDGNIRYFEYENDRLEYLSEYKSADPQRGVAFIPKRGLNLRDNEVMRGFKTVNDSYIEPISFIVPRRAEVFQDDIFPPVTGGRPGMSAAEFFDGKDALPAKIDLESIYNNETPVEVPSDYKPPPPMTPMPPMTPAATTERKSELKPESSRDTPQPSPALRGPVSMKEQGSSMSSIASKFADKDNEESSDDDDASSFEEVPKPIAPRQAAAAITAAPVSPQKQTPSFKETQQATSTASASAAPSISKSADNPSNDDLHNSIVEIKALLQSQTDIVKQLKSDVDSLKASRGDSEKDERIRALEKELAALRSS